MMNTKTFYQDRSNRNIQIWKLNIYKLKVD